MSDEGASEPAEVGTTNARRPVAKVRSDADVPDEAEDRERRTDHQGRTLAGLDPRVRTLWMAEALVPAAVVGVLAGLVDRLLAVVGAPAVVGLVTAGVVLVLGVAHAVVRYRRWGYEVRGDALYLRRGVLVDVRTVVPHVRIQHVDARRGPLERVAGLSSLVVYTAGSRGADVTVPGLTPADAERLQARLKRLAIVAEGEDAV